MTDENCRLNVTIEWEKAQQSLIEVETLMEHCLWDAAISRAYYGLFHMARALLFSHGLETKTHSGLIHMINVHLVRTGELPREMTHLLSRMQRLREDADYQTAMLHDRNMADEALQALQSFHTAAESLLRRRGFLD